MFSRLSYGAAAVLTCTAFGAILMLLICAYDVIAIIVTVVKKKILILFKLLDVFSVLVDCILHHQAC